jgi:hypothetical protein
MAVSLAAKIQVVEGMEAGESWQAALHTVGVQASESTVYLWRQKWRQGGPAALSDRQHWRRHKMNEEIRAQSPCLRPMSASALSHQPLARAECIFIITTINVSKPNKIIGKRNRLVPE